MPLGCLLSAADLGQRFRLRHRGSIGVGEPAENLCDLRIALTTNRHRVAYLHHLEQAHDVAIAEADASVRGGVADRARLIGSVDAKAPLTQADPTWADGVAGTRGNHRAG
jgi:hypothetical protein